VIISGVNNCGGCGGRSSPSSRSIGAVREFTDAAGLVPAEIAVHPSGGFALNIASAINERPEFPTQMNRTTLDAVTDGGLQVSSRGPLPAQLQSHLGRGETPSERHPRESRLGWIRIRP